MQRVRMEAKRVVGFKAEADIDEGLRKTANCYQAYLLGGAVKGRTFSCVFTGKI